MERKKYELTFKFFDKEQGNQLLGMSPLSLEIYITHLVEAKRQAIKDFVQRKSRSRKDLGDTNLDALPIKDEQIDKEIAGLKLLIEDHVGKIDQSLWDQYVESDFSKKSIVYNMIKDKSAMTGFLRDKDGFPIFAEHQVKGAVKDFAKGVCRLQNKRKNGVLLSSANYTTSQLNRFMFPLGGMKFYTDETLTTRKDIDYNENGTPKMLTRPLRSSTPKGEITALASSEMITGPFYGKFTIMTVLKDLDKVAFEKIFNLTDFYGFGQWRNSGKGVCELISVTESKWDDKKDRLNK